MPYSITVRLRLHEEHLLRQPIGGIRLFRIAVPHIVFAEGNRCELWICAYRSGNNYLRHLGKSARLEQLDPHNRVLVEKAAWRGLVSPDAADHRGKMNQPVRSVVVQKLLDRTACSQVVVLAADTDGISSSVGELCYKVTTEEARPSSHHNCRAFEPHDLSCSHSGRGHVDHDGLRWYDHRSIRIRESLVPTHWDRSAQSLASHAPHHEKVELAVMCSSHTAIKNRSSKSRLCSTKKHPAGKLARHQPMSSEKTR